MHNQANNLQAKFPDYYDPYSEQIKKEYFKRPEIKHLLDPFIAMHSDYLNLQIRPDGQVWTKSTFLDKDIILQIRGKTTTEQKLKTILTKDEKYNDKYGVLLWLDLKKKILLLPQGISEKVVRSSLKMHEASSVKVKGNCRIEEHLGSKLLIRATDIIGKQEKLILEDESLKKFRYI